MSIESLKRGYAHSGVYEHIMNPFRANYHDVGLRNCLVSGYKRKENQETARVCNFDELCTTVFAELKFHQ
ncbi:MAG: hypothetical protein AUG13_01085 [Chloroflexi bacterium 13_1_20CM_2_59_7]|nr:MAG: hypothetical protein AUG13_01085 [Chloroflexi bacterium 13_1_20CM_2_59_7]